MAPHLIPGPNNELVEATPPDTSSRYALSVDFATSASYAETASFSLGFILSASYARFAETASYLLGSISNAVSASWAVMSGHALSADTASYSLTAVTASYALNAGSASYALSSSYSNTARTASYVVQAASATSASYALTASYLLGSSATSSYALMAGTASYLSGTASYALLAKTASYVSSPEVELVVSGSNSAYINAFEVDGVVVATIVDSFPTSKGMLAKWLLSINDGTNFKASEILSIWNASNNTTNFAEVTTNALGTIPVAMSVNLSAGNVRLIANPASGSWNIRMVRFLS